MKKVLSGKTKKKKPKLHSQIRSALRKIFMWSEPRQEAFKKSNKICTICKTQFKGKELQVDHIESVGPTPGSRNAGPDTTWDLFITRMFCDADKLQVVCINCHNNKTYKKHA